jgi:CRISPR-associated protein Csd1
MEEILLHIPKADGFPSTLSLQQQALFSLGYYHQRANDRAEASERRAEHAAESDTANTEETND